MILIDTHIWIWWVQGDARLDPAHRTPLDAVLPAPIFLSAFSCREAVTLHEKSKITLPMAIKPWLRLATGYPRLNVVPVTADTAASVAEVPAGLHRDPADRIIVATARAPGVPADDVLPPDPCLPARLDLPLKRRGS